MLRGAAVELHSLPAHQAKELWPALDQAACDVFDREMSIQKAVYLPPFVGVLFTLTRNGRQPSREFVSRIVEETTKQCSLAEYGSAIIMPEPGTVLFHLAATQDVPLPVLNKLLLGFLELTRSLFVTAAEDLRNVEDNDETFWTKECYRVFATCNEVNTCTDTQWRALAKVVEFAPLDACSSRTLAAILVSRRCQGQLNEKLWRGIVVEMEKRLAKGAKLNPRLAFYLLENTLGELKRMQKSSPPELLRMQATLLQQVWDNVANESYSPQDAIRLAWIMAESGGLTIDMWNVIAPHVATAIEEEGAELEWQGYGVTPPETSNRKKKKKIEPPSAIGKRYQSPLLSIVLLRTIRALTPLMKDHPSIREDFATWLKNLFSRLRLEVLAPSLVSASFWVNALDTLDMNDRGVRRRWIRQIHLLGQTEKPNAANNRAAVEILRHALKHNWSSRELFEGLHPMLYDVLTAAPSGKDAQLLILPVCQFLETTGLPSELAGQWKNALVEAVEEGLSRGKLPPGGVQTVAKTLQSLGWLKPSMLNAFFSGPMLHRVRDNTIASVLSSAHSAGTLNTTLVQGGLQALVALQGNGEKSKGRRDLLGNSASIGLRLGATYGCLDEGTCDALMATVVNDAEGFMAHQANDPNSEYVWSPLTAKAAAEAVWGAAKAGFLREKDYRVVEDWFVSRVQEAPELLMKAGATTLKTGPVGLRDVGYLLWGGYFSGFLTEKNAVALLDMVCGTLCYPRGVDVDLGFVLQVSRSLDSLSNEDVAQRQSLRLQDLASIFLSGSATGTLRLEHQRALLDAIHFAMGQPPSLGLEDARVLTNASSYAGVVDPVLLGSLEDTVLSAVQNLDSLSEHDTKILLAMGVSGSSLGLNSKTEIRSVFRSLGLRAFRNGWIDEEFCLKLLWHGTVSEILAPDESEGKAEIVKASQLLSEAVRRCRALQLEVETMTWDSDDKLAPIQLTSTLRAAFGASLCLSNPVVQHMSSEDREALQAFAAMAKRGERLGPWYNALFRIKKAIPATKSLQERYTLINGVPVDAYHEATSTVVEMYGAPEHNLSLTSGRIELDHEAATRAKLLAACSDVDRVIQVPWYLWQLLGTTGGLTSQGKALEGWLSDDYALRGEIDDLWQKEETSEQIRGAWWEDRQQWRVERWLRSRGISNE